MLSKRQARFGIVEPAAKSSSTPAKPAGTAAPAAGAAAASAKKSGLVLDAAEEEKKRKRAAKFGVPSVCFSFLFTQLVYYLVTISLLLFYLTNHSFFLFLFLYYVARLRTMHPRRQKCKAGDGMIAMSSSIQRSQHDRYAILTTWNKTTF